MAQAVYDYDSYDNRVRKAQGKERKGKERSAHAGNDAMKGNECEEENVRCWLKVLDAPIFWPGRVKVRSGGTGGTGAGLCIVWMGGCR